MSTKKDTPTPEQELETLRSLMLGENGEYVREALKTHSRDMVTDVVSEALVDRQRTDSSVELVVTPLVEKSVERSVANHSEKFTTILYPLVGSLVRKSVSAFLAQFIEKTNAIIESAVSVKGLKWRYQAWRAGIPFSQFLAAQTYVYRVEQILLIHRESGLLIKSVALNPSADEDADIISSMLTAINDFVNDSFTSQAENQQLDEIKTDDLTLLISHGPKARLVAAVSGVAPYEVKQRFHATLERLHTLFVTELASFDGDSAEFETSDPMLRECLLVETKTNESASKGQPWFGYVFVGILLAGAVWLGYHAFSMHQLRNQLAKIDAEPGIALTKIESISRNKIAVHVLRDPAGKPIEAWLLEQEIDADKIQVLEQSFLSIEPDIVLAKLAMLAIDFDGIAADLSKSTPVLSGKLGWQQLQAFNRRYYAIPGIDQLAIDRTQLVLQDVSMQAEEQPAIQRQLFEQLVGEIARIQVSFAVNEVALDQQAQLDVTALSSLLVSAFNLADKLNLSANLIIIGASDASGVSSVNTRLSLERANAVKTALINQGIAIDRMVSAGIGEVTLSSDAVATRRVMFNVMYTQTEKNQTGAQ